MSKFPWPILIMVLGAIAACLAIFVISVAPHNGKFTPVPTPTIITHPCHPQLVRHDLDVVRHAYQLDRAGHRTAAFNYLGTHYQAIAKDECHG